MGDEAAEDADDPLSVVHEVSEDAPTKRVVVFEGQGSGADAPVGQ